MAEYKLTNKVNGKESTVNQKSYDSIKARGWLKNFHVEILSEGSKKMNKKSVDEFVPPEVQRMSKGNKNKQE